MSALPIVLIEGVLILGGTLAFGWWQLRSIRRDQEAARAKREAEAAAAAPGAEVDGITAPSVNEGVPSEGRRG